MARHETGGGMTRLEKLLGGCLLAVYLVGLPLAADPLLDWAEGLLGCSITGGVRDAAYHYTLFALTVLVFGGFLCRTTRAGLEHIWRVLGSAGLGLAVFCGANELCWRLLSLIPAGQANLNDAAISARLDSSPSVTLLIVVFLAPFVEEVLFRGYLFGNLREYSRAGAYLASSLGFALVHVWQYAVAARSPAYLLAAVQYVVPGLVMAWTYERSGSLWGSVLLHSIINGVSAARLL